MCFFLILKRVLGSHLHFSFFEKCRRAPFFFSHPDSPPHTPRLPRILSRSKTKINFNSRYLNVNKVYIPRRNSRNFKQIHKFKYIGVYFKNEGFEGTKSRGMIIVRIIQEAIQSDRNRKEPSSAVLEGNQDSLPQMAKLYSGG